MSDFPEADGFVLLNDQPVSEPDGQDVLGMAGEVSGLASLIMGSRESAPFTVGIDAGWGMGKSSIMLQLQAALDMQPGVVTSWFNAWTAQDDDALAGLIKSALMSVDENMLRRTLRKVTRHRSFLTGLRVTFIVVASFFHLARVVDQLWDILSVDASGRNAIRGDLQEIFNSWAAKTKRTPTGRLLVVFVDDLDRCSSEVVVAVCEAVKLYLAVPGIVFVLGCDQDILAQAALDSGRVSKAATSLGYLEKIVQITYRKPAPDEDQMTQLVEHYAMLSRTTDLFADSAKQVVVQGTGRNPRRIKRLINSFILEYRLDPGWASLGAEALISVILLQHFYPEFYRELARPAGSDVAHEFLVYHELRGRLLLGGPPSDSDRKFFEDHGVMPPTQDEPGNAEAVNRLEQELPLSFPGLARRPEFVQLLTTLSNHDDFERLMSRLQSRTLAEARDFIVRGVDQVSAGLETDVRASGDGRTQGRQENERSVGSTDLGASAFKDYNILLIGNEDDYLTKIVDDTLRRYVGSRRLSFHNSGPVIESIRDALVRGNPDVIVSRVGSGESYADAVAVLSTLRQEGRYLGPAIILADRVTPARMRQASSADASLTDDPDYLVQFLDATASAKTPLPSFK
jgi:hypothetical protein